MIHHCVGSDYILVYSPYDHHPTIPQHQFTIMTTSSSTPVSTTPLATDVLAGLSQYPKKLPSKYFYDARGDELFQQIMRMPEYYLTDCEFEILEKHRQDILDHIGHQRFELVELGAGDGYKTKVLLRHFLERGEDFRYCPVDISGNVLRELEDSLKADLPDLSFNCLPGDYFDMLGDLQGRSKAPKVILFLGANIGNMARAEALGFLQRIRANMLPKDLLLIGFDLKKDPEVILRAYNDPAGITAAFNLNLLTRINRELDANFQLEHFRHWETYNPLTGATKSYILSTRRQSVYIKGLDRTFHFEPWEAMDVELSQKYSIFEVEALLQEAGLTPVQHFTDQRRYFLDSLVKANTE